MNRKQLERMGYVKPECEIIEADAEQFICTSVHPHTGSYEEDWDPDTEVDGGEVELE
ncbi:hypothetical protein [Hoylesella enoeca]|uniref:hypothetical protein n=1 Tax=Hoylesella enoeca TaxID=76123 RepID=UPI0012E33A20|nr:hypothetical protein [Hoylesella enoeca]